MFQRIQILPVGYSKWFLDQMNEKYGGLKPSTSENQESIFAYNRTRENCHRSRLDACDNIGKWMIFRPTEEIDEVWDQIKTACENGKLTANAKVQTFSDYPGKLALYIWTKLSQLPF